MRELERQNETAHMGPGAHDSEKPFGSGMNNAVTMGSKYKFKPKEGPPPGAYNPEKAMKLVKPKAYEAFIEGEERKEGVLLDGSKPTVDGGADPGAYSGHLKPFGDGL